MRFHPLNKKKKNCGYSHGKQISAKFFIITQNRNKKKFRILTYYRRLLKEICLERIGPLTNFFLIYFSEKKLYSPKRKETSEKYLYVYSEQKSLKNSLMHLFTKNYCNWLLSKTVGLFFDVVLFFDILYFFFVRPTFGFHVQEEIYIACGHIIGFFFLLQKDLDTFYRLLFEAICFFYCI